MKNLNHRLRGAMLEVLNGADVYDYALAKDLRDVQKRRPEFIDIGKPQMYKGSGKAKVPYFGAIITAAGREYLKQITQLWKRANENK